jgi:glycosyltransferase involved in cell wall biosynthesis
MISCVHPSFDTRIFHREAFSLAKNGFEIFLIIQHEFGDIFLNGIHIKGIKKPNSRFQRILFQWKYFFLVLKKHADIYHFHDPELIPFGILVKLFTQKPVIYDVHEHYTDAILLKEWLPGFTRKIVAKLFDLMECLTAPIFSAIITADATVAERFKDSGKPVVILFNYPKKNFFQNINIGRRIRSNETQIVYVGSISQERGQWMMLDIIRMLVTQKGLDVGLWIAGSFDSKNKELQFLRTVENDQILRNRVNWLGVVPQNELPELLASANIGLIPLQPVDKFYKNIPTKLFEYMAAGLPFVASDLPPIRKYVSRYRVGCLAKPGNPRSYMEQIIFLRDNPELAKKMGENGRCVFLTRFNWDTEEEKLIALYQDLLGTKK